MLAALRVARIACGSLAAVLFAMIATSNIIAVTTAQENPGFLGSTETPLTIIAYVLLAVTILSVPFLRNRTHNHPADNEAGGR